jgi:Ca2+-transporting ATPase
LILLPVQILWINLVTDSISALSLSVEKAEDKIMEKPPRDVNHPILDKTSLTLLLVFGSYIALATLGVYHFYLDQNSYALANTVAFTAMVVLSNTGVLNFRSFDKPTHVIGWFSNPWLLAAVTLMLALQAMTLYLPILQDALDTVPLGWKEWTLIIAAAIPMVFFSEIYKTLKFRQAA